MRSYYLKKRYLKFEILSNKFILSNNKINCIRKSSEHLNTIQEDNDEKSMYATKSQQIDPANTSNP